MIARLDVYHRQPKRVADILTYVAVDEPVLKGLAVDDGSRAVIPHVESCAREECHVCPIKHERPSQVLV